MTDLREKKHLILNGFPLQDSHRGRGVGRYTYRVYDEILKRWERQDPILTNAFCAITVVGATTPSLSEVFDDKYQKTKFVSIAKKVEKRNILKYFYYKWIAGPALDSYLQTIAEPTVYFLPRQQILSSKYADYTVTMVHDVAPLKTHRWGKNQILDPLLSIEYNLYLQELKKSDLIVTNSDDTSHALERFIGRKEDMHSVLLGNIFEHQKPESALNKPAPIREPYFFYFGGFDFNKNIPGIIKAFALFIRKHEDTNHTKLVFSGGIKIKDQIIKLAKAEGVLENMVLIDNVPDEDLAWYIVHSLGLFRLSFIEGCGLPEIEVMSLGVPVISAAIGAVQEMVGQYAFLVNPHKPELAEPILYKLARKKVPVEQLSAGAAHARTFTWSKTANQTIETIIEYTQSHKPARTNK